MLMMSRVPRISALYKNRGRVLSKGRIQIWVQNLLPCPYFCVLKHERKAETTAFFAEDRNCHHSNLWNHPPWPSSPKAPSSALDDVFFLGLLAPLSRSGGKVKT